MGTVFREPHNPRKEPAVNKDLPFYLFLSALVLAAGYVLGQLFVGVVNIDHQLDFQREQVQMQLQQFFGEH